LKFEASKSPQQHIDTLREVMLNTVWSSFMEQASQNQSTKPRQIEMFQQIKGFEVGVSDQK
jgi:hypothetical protein